MQLKDISYEELLGAIKDLFVIIMIMNYVKILEMNYNIH